MLQRRERLLQLVARLPLQQVQLLRRLEQVLLVLVRLLQRLERAPLGQERVPQRRELVLPLLGQVLLELERPLLLELGQLLLGQLLGNF